MSDFFHPPDNDRDYFNTIQKKKKKLETKLKHLKC